MNINSQRPKSHGIFLMEGATGEEIKLDSNPCIHEKSVINYFRAVASPKVTRFFLLLLQFILRLAVSEEQDGSDKHADI
jgi:hypothetical protein